MKRGRDLSINLRTTDFGEVSCIQHEQETTGIFGLSDNGREYNTCKEEDGEKMYSTFLTIFFYSFESLYVGRNIINRWSS